MRFSTTRRLPVPKAPAVVQTVTPDQLVSDLNRRWNAMKSMTAKVEIQASVLKAEKGVATDYTTICGVILFSKPENLRQFLEVSQTLSPLPDGIPAEIAALQRRWYAEHDRHAAPWSM